MLSIISHQENANQNQNDTSNEQPKKEIKNIIPFTIESKRIKYLRISLTKEVKDLYAESYKTQLKDLNKFMCMNWKT